MIKEKKKMQKTVIDVYSKMSKDNPPWTAEEEKAFVASCTTKSGKWKSKAMKDKFVAEALKRNIGLVFSLVNQFCFNAQNEDIVQLAMVSLADALKKWDPKRGLKISTWVRNPIKWAILRAQGAYAKTGTIAEEIAAKNHRFGRKWSVVAMDAELAGKEGDGGETIANLITPASVAPDYINAHSIKTREEEIHDNDVRSGVKELMDSMGDYLNKKEIKVIMGIFNGHSLAEIGVKMKLSRMRISQISRDAFAKIKKSPLGDRLHALVKAG